MRLRTKFGIGLGVTAATLVPANMLLDDSKEKYAERADALEECLPSIGTAACQEVIQGELLEPSSVLPAEGGYLYVYTQGQVQDRIDDLREWSEASNLEKNVGLAGFGLLMTGGFILLGEQHKRARRDLLQQQPA